jgi:hypothetical protein
MRRDWGFGEGMNIGAAWFWRRRIGHFLLDFSAYVRDAETNPQFLFLPVEYAARHFLKHTGKANVSNVTASLFLIAFIQR